MPAPMPLLATFLAAAGPSALGARLLRTPDGVAPDGQKVTYDKEAFGKDWGSEWDRGNFPSYEKTHRKTYYDPKDYEDSQSDGKPSAGLTGPHVGAYLSTPLPQEAALVERSASKPEEAAAPAPGAVKYDDKAFKDAWGSEWKNGDFPSYRITNEKAKKFMDSQSDGKPSPGLTGSKVGAYLPMPLPQDFPKSKPGAEVRHPAAMMQKDSPEKHPETKSEEAKERPAKEAEREAEEPAGVETPPGKIAIDHEAFKDSWGKEWRNGNYPSYRITNKKAKKFMDSQSDGLPSPGLTGRQVGAYLPQPLPQDFPAMK